MASSSLRRSDLLELAGLRNDGRKAEELRRIQIQMGCLLQSPSCSGSCLFEMGLTAVLATVRGPLECTRRSDELVDRAILDVTVKVAPFASMMDRRVINSSTDRRLLEQSYQLQRAMEAAIQLHLYPKSKIEILVWILADDGSRLMAAINATTLALVDAGIPIHDLVCACSAGLGTTDASSDTPLLDLNRKEESSFGGQPAVVVPCAMMPQRDTFVLAQCEARLGSAEELERVLGAAMMGCKTFVLDLMQAAIREHATSILKARSGQYMLQDVFSKYDDGKEGKQQQQRLPEEDLMSL